MLRSVRNETELTMLLAFLKNRKCPFSVEITDGRRRSVSQNKLQRLWLLEIAEQLGDQTPEEVRGYCKLTLGVPILRAENDEFREKYDAVLKALSYQSKVAIMMEPLNLPVTRVMTVDQKSRYLDGIHRHFSEQGLALTDPTM